MYLQKMCKIFINFLGAQLIYRILFPNMSGGGYQHTGLTQRQFDHLVGTPGFVADRSRVDNYSNPAYNSGPQLAGSPS